MANGNDVTSSIGALCADLLQPGMGKKKATRFWVALVYTAFYLLLMNVTLPCQPSESTSLQNNNGKDVNGKIHNVIVAVQDRLFSP